MMPCAAACLAIRSFSHSETLTPERRAAALAASRISSSIPLMLHGTPDFIIRPLAAARPPPTRRSLGRRACRSERKRESRPYRHEGKTSANMVNKQLTCRPGGENFG